MFIDGGQGLQLNYVTLAIAPLSPMPDTRGLHLLIEYHGCCPQTLNDVVAIEALLLNAARAAGATVVTSTFHRFAQNGVSGVVVVQESHLSIHTWPEHGYAAVDIYTCGACVPEQAHLVIRDGVAAQQTEQLTVRRGQGPMRIRRQPWSIGDSITGTD